METKTVTLQDAQRQLPELLKLVTAGSEVLVTDGHQLLARIVPVWSPSLLRVAGLHLGNCVISPDFDNLLPETFWTGEEH
ncbi:MAG TPA: toxin-antitoxin (TA) system antitoxin [Roseiflexaceae bacterium]|nr:toxin-antitoxin (TA) system antitoxin [Roseiflexaceae bacterium]